jgi:DNA-binding MarR family transcriptional regulator
MRHRVTNRATEQRGTPPATKRVLWHLCDRRNPHCGCFPSRDQLAADVENSRASLNTHLDRMERAGLIRRERRHEADAHMRRVTRYVLGFGVDFPAGVDPVLPPEKPCPDSGHEPWK